MVADLFTDLGNAIARKAQGRCERHVPSWRTVSAIAPALLRTC